MIMHAGYERSSRVLTESQLRWRASCCYQRRVRPVGCEGAGSAPARAQAAGELANGVEPATAARLLICLVEGMRVVGKTCPDRAMSQAVVQTLIDRFTK